MELGQLGHDGPTRRRASGRTAWRPGLRTGAERSKGQGCDYADDSGGRGAAGRRRTGPEVVDPAGERSADWRDDGRLCTVA